MILGPSGLSNLRYYFWLELKTNLTYNLLVTLGPKCTLDRSDTCKSSLGGKGAREGVVFSHPAT
jgi:hypothetical protein